jgi:hypothetical protein
MDTVLTLIYLCKRQLHLAHINLLARRNLHKNHKSVIKNWSKPTKTHEPGQVAGSRCCRKKAQRAAATVEELSGDDDIQQKEFWRRVL